MPKKGVEYQSSFPPFPSTCKCLLIVDTDLCVSNLPVEDLIKDDETVRGVRRTPLNQHIGRLCRHNLMGNGAWDVIGFFCKKTQKKEKHFLTTGGDNVLSDKNLILNAFGVLFANTECIMNIVCVCETDT